VITNNNNNDDDDNNNNGGGSSSSSVDGGGGRSVSLEIFAIIIVLSNSVKLLWHLVSYFYNRTEKRRLQVIVELKKVGNGRIHMIRNSVISTVQVFTFRRLWWGRCLT